MSRTFYCFRKDATVPVGSHGPLTELDEEYRWGETYTLDPSLEQELEAGCCGGPNLANVNAATVLRDPELYRFDAADLHSRCVLAAVVPPLQR